LEWWEDKYVLFRKTTLGLIVAAVVTLVLWFAKRQEASLLANGGVKRVYVFKPFVRWFGIGITAALLFFDGYLVMVYWQDLHGYVSTPELGVLLSANPNPDDTFDADKDHHRAMYIIGGDDGKEPERIAHGSLMLELYKKDNAKYVEIVRVAVIVEQYKQLGKPVRRAAGSTMTETRVLEYRADLDNAIGNYQAKRVQQGRQPTLMGNPVIDHGVPVQIVVAVRGKEGEYVVRGEIVIRYHGKEETTHSDKSVRLVCFKDGKMPKGPPN
jgi:hypothetical protein